MTTLVTSQSQSLERIIRPNRAWFRIDWAGLLHYRDLLYLLVRRDFVARYQQTILGPSWFVLQPLIMTLAFTMIFSRVLGTPTDGIPPFLFYQCGMLGWTYFANVLSSTGNTFGSNAGIFTKVYFPRLIIPLALAISSCIPFAIQLVTFLAMLAYNVVIGRVVVTWPHVATALAVMPLIVFHTAILALGVGLLMAAVTAKYRDFQHLTGFVVQLWMYASPVIYPFSRIEHRFPGMAWIAALNPMSAVIENVRALFFGSPFMPLPFLALSIGAAVTVFVVGVLVYQRTARTFVDTV